METKSLKNVWLEVTGLLARYGKDTKGRETFMLESVMFGDDLIRDHIRVRGWTGIGRGTRVKLYAKIGTYFHNGMEKYCLQEYRFI